ncbi:MAG TPA: hypothetical protein VHV27_04095, partial [Phenylobacterium sp.]|nr:hypothetical protein [Phenylobacterium sp.]
ICQANPSSSCKFPSLFFQPYGHVSNFLSFVDNRRREPRFWKLSIPTNTVTLVNLGHEKGNKPAAALFP